MRHISPDEFVHGFQYAVGKYETHLVDLWMRNLAREIKADQYTTFIRTDFLPLIASELELEVYSRGDYYTLDSVFYEENDTKHFRRGIYATYIAIALEHENLLQDTNIEMNKLQILNTPLKVLITYTNTKTDRRRKGDFLAGYARIMRAADVFDDFTTHRRQLVIFGNLDAGRINFTYHVYRDGEFVCLE